MKKRIIFISICFAIVLLILPFKYYYFDGGTVEYRAVLYSVIKWHSLDNNFEEGYKTGTEFHFFPTNLRRIDYYKNNEPQRLELNYKGKKYYASTLDYDWCNKYKNCTSREVLLVKEVEFNDAIKVEKNDIIDILPTNSTINNVVIYKGTLDNMYTQDIEYTDDYIKIPNESGNYVYIINSVNEKNKVNYLFKIVVD